MTLTYEIPNHWRLKGHMIQWNGPIELRYGLALLTNYIAVIFTR